MKGLTVVTEGGIDFGTLFAPVSSGVIDSITSSLPVAIPVLVALAGISIAIKVFGKFGVRK